MDKLVKAFTRVQRGTSVQQEILEAISDLKNGSLAPSDVPLDICNGILDLPDLDAMEMSLHAKSSLNRVDLVKRAKHSPSDLTTDEIILLKGRYWTDQTDAEAARQSSALSGLLAVGQEHWKETTEQLKRIRSLICEDEEEDAIFEAAMEEWRRRMDSSKQRQRAEVEKQMWRAQPWVKRLWEEEHGDKEWGFMIFVSPEIEDRERWGAHMGALLWKAMGAVGCVGIMSRQWKLWSLQWPAQEVADGNSKSLEASDPKDQNGQKDHEGELQGEDSTEDAHGNAQPREHQMVEDTSLAPEDTFERLRQHFKMLSTRPKKRRRTDDWVNQTTLSPSDSIPSNVFLVATQTSTNSLYNTPILDDAWIWAVDPDFEPHTTTAEPSSTKINTEYRGYLKVRVQQLAHNFYDLRRYHGQEYSLKQLWEAAQNSKHKAFVSVREEEQKMYRSEGGGGGSALRKPNTQRIVYSIDDL
ncbi:hypothetical protein B0A48_05232 [Cryoendolithus antarcticus]|uniref:Uncharacterized protein n=1 Tax=Cryoendolithus antarcticus TaxID=1507870 RepID=A0A1V8THW7_9PEZI|nr:hypothetical protein B0A48_05232 [Cryoendolithus antarcticus]